MRTETEPSPSFFEVRDLSSASIGIDLTFVPEFAKVMEDSASFFLKETFTEWERGRAKSKPKDQSAYFFAGRYAAKEAFIKALDGRRLFLEPDLKLKYSEIEIRNDDYGRPYFRFYGNIAEYIRSLNPSSIRLSISHTEDYAFSEVLLIL